MMEAMISSLQPDDVSAALRNNFRASWASEYSADNLLTVPEISSGVMQSDVAATGAIRNSGRPVPTPFMGMLKPDRIVAGQIARMIIAGMHFISSDLLNSSAVPLLIRNSKR